MAVEPLGVGAHFIEIHRSATQQMAEGQLDVAVAGAGVEETLAVQIALGDAAHQFAHADLAQLELGFGHELTLAFHHVGVAEHLLVDGADDLFLAGVVIAGDQLERRFALLGEAFDPEKRGRTEGHGQPDVFARPCSFRTSALERLLYKAQSNVSKCCVT